MSKRAFLDRAFGEQMMGEQFFIEVDATSAEKSGNRNPDIFAIFGEPGGHRMPGLVRERVNIGKHIFL